MNLSRETFDQAASKVKLGYLFDLSFDIRERVIRLENRKTWHKSLSFLGGFVGGFMAVVLLKVTPLGPFLLKLF